MIPPILTRHTVQKTTGAVGTPELYRAEVSQLLLDHSSGGVVRVTPDLFDWLSQERPAHQQVSRAPGQVNYQLDLFWPFEGLTIQVSVGGSVEVVHEKALKHAWKSIYSGMLFPGVVEAERTFAKVGLYNTTLEVHP